MNNNQTSSLTPSATAKHAEFAYFKPKKTIVGE